MKSKILFIVLSIFYLQDVAASGSDFLYPETESAPFLRKRISCNETEKILRKPVISDENDKIFSDLGECWNLFKQEDYETSFRQICILASAHNPKAEYLLGEFHEKGLGKIIKSLKGAATYYTRAVADSQNFYLLKRKAETALIRVLGELRENPNVP